MTGLWRSPGRGNRRAATPPLRDNAVMGRAPRLRIGLTARVRLATLGVAVALGAVFAVLLHTVDVSRSRDAQARRSADVLEAAAGIEGSVIDLETGLRGYVIGKQIKFLEPYQR